MEEKSWVTAGLRKGTWRAGEGKRRLSDPRQSGQDDSPMLLSHRRDFATVRFEASHQRRTLMPKKQRSRLSLSVSIQ